MKVRAALIDLDGTLLDTIPDMAAAANRMLGGLGLKELPEGQVRDFVGKGLKVLVRRCLDAALGEGAAPESLVERADAAFGNFYEQESGRRTQPYPGVVDGLDDLVHQGIALACVTNKIARYTHPLLRRVGLAGRFSVVIAGDDVRHPKPDPEPYLQACARLGVEPSAAVVIGDSANDAAAGRAAGCRVLCVPYGYTEGKPASQLDCDAHVNDLRAAAKYVRDANQAMNETAR